MNAQLAFNIKDNNTNTFCFQVLDKAADNANILTVFYKEDSKDMAEYKPEGEEVDPTQIGNGDVYVAIGSGSKRSILQNQSPQHQVCFENSIYAKSRL